MAAAPCPECGKPTTLRGRFCPACGWDADVEEGDEGYLDGVDLPQGYGPEEGTADRRMHPIWVVLALLALAGFIATAVL
jgi:hypothetical protein